MARKLSVPISDKVALPPAGIHEGVPFHLYQEWPALNQSALKWGLTTAKHMKAAVDGLMSKSGTEAQRMGRALHSKLLEPDTFNLEWAISEGCAALLGDASKRAGEACGKAASRREIAAQITETQVDGEEETKQITQPLRWFCGTHAKQVPCEEPPNFLTFDQVSDIDAICEQMKADPTIALLRSLGGREVSLVYELAGVLCKARLDKLILGGPTAKGDYWPPTIVDLKKVRVGHGDGDNWENAVRNYRYDIQAAWYIDAVAAITGEAPLFMWVMMEESCPYDINVKFAEPATVTLGRREYQRLFGMYQYGLESGEWPGYKGSPKIGSTGCPEWFLKKRNEYLDTVGA